MARDFHALLYNLKKDWGTKISWVTVFADEVDPRTGDREIVRQAYDLSAIRLPSKMVRQFIQDIAYLAANKNFTYGGLNDFVTAMFVIEPRDLPRGLDVNLNGWINHNGQRLDRSGIEFLGNFCYLVTTKAIEGDQQYATIRRRQESNLQLRQRVVLEMN